ncbi:hypothetical protein HIM_08104 [Hirsutella minnesotensis 3608]|uniref:Uncharacterized protein n=1 Tax=Hirsutella minnesotensis 3608 TaxID=1043627 RepID=A0A0F7ZMR0_9HYPO|nr:hypothetical protein HIM_08104 [Hirsutella minnesotensis 3608]
MQVLSTLFTLLAGFAMVQAAPHENTKRQCGIDEYGRQFCNNTPQCTNHPDGSVSCVV